LEQREEFGNPDIATTEGIKSGSYAKLNDGIIKKGTKIGKGDAVIGKYMRIPKMTEQGNTMSDRSLIYKEKEEAIVHNVITDRNEDDERFCKVALRKVRPVAVGDKFCLTPDHEVLTSTGWKLIKEVNELDYVATLNQSTHKVEFNQPTELHRYNHDGKLYHVKSWDVDLVTTLNHKMYVRGGALDNFKLVPAKALVGNSSEVHYKKDCINELQDVDEFVLPGIVIIGPGRSSDRVIHEKVFNMNLWIKFFGIYSTHGMVVNNKQVCIDVTNPLVNIMAYEVLGGLGYKWVSYESQPNYLYIDDRQLADYLVGHGGVHERKLPEWCFTLSKAQSSSLLHYILMCIGNGAARGYWQAQTRSEKFAGAIQALAIMSGYTAKVEKGDLAQFSEATGDFYTIYIMVTNNGGHDEPLIAAKHEKMVPYTGSVYCITVPNNVFMVRRNGTNIWTGNSSRAGQKGVTGILLRDSDMPFTEDGLRPSIIMNPHAIPSRMTIGQLYETQAANWCAMKGTTTDATIFKYVDIESMGDELEALGMHRYGYHRLYSGITGEYIDALIFMGPTYYQRLQKFVIDTVYSISQGPSDAISRQPLDQLVQVAYKSAASLFAGGDTFKLREPLVYHTATCVAAWCKRFSPNFVWKHAEGFRENLKMVM
jgi:hypothetical protein